jgi:hypothetical protein
MEFKFFKFERWDGVVRNGLVWLRIETKGGLFR